MGNRCGSFEMGGVVPWSIARIWVFRIEKVCRDLVDLRVWRGGGSCRLADFEGLS